MGIGQGLWVTVAGMGLVFLALGVLMVAMMLLDRFFPYHEDSYKQASEPELGRRANGPVPAPASAPTAPAPAPTPGPIGRYEMTLAGQRHRVELKSLTGQPMLVSVDGREYRVEQRNGGSPQLVVDGQAYPARVVEAASDHVVVAIGEQSFRIELPAIAPSPTSSTAAPASAPTPASAAPAEGTRVEAPLPGRVLRVLVAVGDSVKRGQELCVIEAMKMENSIRASQDGVVREVRVQAGQQVTPGELLLVI